MNFRDDIAEPFLFGFTGAIKLWFAIIAGMFNGAAGAIAEFMKEADERAAARERRTSAAIGSPGGGGQR